MRIGEVARSAAYRMDEKSKIWQFLVFQIEKNSRNLLILLFGQLRKISIWRIWEIVNLKKSEKFRFCKTWKICKLQNSKKKIIWKGPKIFNLANSKNLQFGEFEKLSI